MTLDKKKIFLKRGAVDGLVDPHVAEALAARRKEGALSCSEAFDVARKLDIAAIEVGKAMDLLEIKIIKCQLGLFRHKGEKLVTPDDHPQEVLRSTLSPFREAGRMPCSRAFEIAREMDIGRQAVANACEALGIKITPCQLGAF